MHTRSTALAIAFATALIVGWFLLTPAAGIDALRSVVFGPWFPVALVALYAVRPVLGWPISLCSALVGYRYGLLLGLPIALVGAVGTSLLPYALGRRYGPDAGGLLGRLVRTSTGFFGAAGDIRGVIAARLAPTHPEPVSAGAGAGGVPPVAFAIGTAIGEVPWTVAALLAGTSLSAWGTEHVTPPAWLFGAGILGAALLLAGPAYRWASRREGTPA